MLVMDEEENEAKWIPLAPIPLLFENKYATPIIYDKNPETILIVLSPCGECGSIKIYNKKENRWKDLLLFERKKKSNIHIHIHTLAVNRKTLYFYDGKLKHYKLDKKNAEFIQIKPQNQNENENEFNRYLMTEPQNVESRFFNGEFHVVGYGKKSETMQHFSWNPHTNNLKQYSFGNGSDLLLMEGYALCCLQKSGSILLLGGRKLSATNICCLHSIFAYKALGNGFVKTGHFMPHRMAYFGCIVSDDEQYLIIFGGSTDNAFLDEIGILNLETFEWIRSDLRCPAKGKYVAVRDGEFVHLFDEYGQHSKMLISYLLPTRSQNSKSKWITSLQTPYSAFCKPVTTLDGDIILSAYNQQTLFIFKACDNNQNEAEWLPFISLPTGMKFNQHTICMHDKCNKLYLYNGACHAKSKCRFIELDVNTKSIINVWDNTLNDAPNVPETGKYPISAMLNNRLHIIGGSHTKCTHLTWDAASHCFVEHKMQNGPQYDTIRGEGIISLEAAKQIIVFGGNESTYFGGYLDKIWICDSLNNFVWKTSIFKLPQAMYGFGYILTQNEKNVVIFGGKTKKSLCDDIFTLEISTFKWKKSVIKCPKKARFHAVLIVSNDNVHLFEIGSQNHWKIHLSLILKNKRQTKKHRKNMKKIETLETELQCAKQRIFELESNEQKLIEENILLRAENEKLKQQNCNGKLHRTLRSDTFLLLTDEDFETDDCDEYETEESNLTDMKK